MVLQKTFDLSFLKFAECVSNQRIAGILSSVVSQLVPFLDSTA